MMLQNININYKRNNVKLLSVLERLDDSPESTVMESLLMEMAKYESKNLAREVMKGSLENARTCRHNGGLPPLGYSVDPKTQQYIINQEALASFNKEKRIALYLKLKKMD